MRCIQKVSVFATVIFFIGSMQCDPTVFIKNNSDRPITIELFDKKNMLMAQAQLVEAKSEYIEENVNAGAVGSVRFKYCPIKSSCRTLYDIRTYGTETVVV